MILKEASNVYFGSNVVKNVYWRQNRIQLCNVISTNCFRE